MLFNNNTLQATDLWLLTKYLYILNLIIPCYHYILFWPSICVSSHDYSRFLPRPTFLHPGQIQKAFVPAAFTKMIAAVSSGMIAAIKR